MGDIFRHLILKGGQQDLWAVVRGFTHEDIPESLLELFG